jgi:hypothetical protein
VDRANAPSSTAYRIPRAAGVATSTVIVTVGADQRHASSDVEVGWDEGEDGHVVCPPQRALFRSTV